MPKVPLRKSVNKLNIPVTVKSSESNTTFVSSCSDTPSGANMTSPVPRDSACSSYFSTTGYEADDEMRSGTDTSNFSNEFFVPLPSEESASLIEINKDKQSKEKLTKMFENLDLEKTLTHSYYSKIDLNTKGEIAQIDNNVKMNEELESTSVITEASYDSDDSSDDCQRMGVDDDNNYYLAGRKIYTSKLLVNDSQDSTSNGSLVPLLNFNISDDDSQEPSTSSKARPSTTR